MEILLISLTFGNIDVQKYARSSAIYSILALGEVLVAKPISLVVIIAHKSLRLSLHVDCSRKACVTILTDDSCLRNTVSLFHILDEELEWRRKIGRQVGYEALRRHPPLVAVGADGPVEGQHLMPDYFCPSKARAYAIHTQERH